MSDTMRVAFFAVMAVAVWAYMGWQIRGWWRARRARQERQAERGLRPTQTVDPHRRRRHQSTALIVFAVALAVVFFAIHQFGSEAARRRMWRIDRIMRWFGAGAGALVLLLSGLLVVMWWWQRDKAIVAAAKLALAGQHDDAIDLLRRTIDAEGETTQRLNVLGLLLHDRGRDAEALPLFERAEALAPPTGIDRDAAINNRALALAKLGRVDEAIDLFRGVCERQPNDCVAACNLATTLADAGRETEAYEQLERAEQIYEQYDERQVPPTWKASIEACRERLPTARGVSGAAAGG